MFGLFKPTLPVSEEQRCWVDESFIRLASLLGGSRLLDAKPHVPTQECFPDPYDRSEPAVAALFLRVARGMQVDPDIIDLELFSDTSQATQSLVPFWSGNSAGAGGLYYHEPQTKTSIGINRSKLADPTALVATLAHELGHVILLRPGLVDRNDEDMEPLNDLLTVFLGFGVFNANSAFQFQQYTNPDSQGWSTRRLGYLSEELFGYALARFAFERGDLKPEWAKHLNTNIAAYFKRSVGWLRQNGRSLALDKYEAMSSAREQTTAKAEAGSSLRSE